jgi:hypothetical protein
MADKTPVRVVFNASNVATGMAEFQSGDSVPVANGGTGLTSIGSAGQIIKVNAAGNALEFGAEGDLSITNLVAPTNADLTLSTSGTGNIVLDQITLRGTTFSSTDSSSININEGLIVDGTLIASGQATLGGLAYPTSDGSVNQVIATNGSGTLSFISAASTGTLNFIGQTISGPSNADISIQPGGTGDVLLSALRVNGTTLDSSDSSKITLAEAVDVTGALVAATSINIAGDGATVTGVKDEDNMASNSATKLATQQSIKAYVDGEVAGLSQTSISQGNSNVTVVDSGTGNITIEVDGVDRLTTVAATTTTATGHSFVIGAGSASAAGQIKFLEGTDNGTQGVILIGPASTGDVTVTLPAATDTLVGKATTDTFTNKTFDVEATGNSISNIDVSDLKSGVLDTDITSVSGSDDTLASAKAIKTYVDAQVTASDLDFATDDSTALSIDLDSETLQVSGGANVSTSGSGNTITIALDTSLSGLTSVTSTALVTNKISSSDSTAVRLDDALNVDGALDVGGGFTISNTTSVTSIVDEDAMGSDSASALATQQSIKAYVDTQDANIASDTLTLTNKTIDANGTGNNISNIDIANMTAASVVLESEGIASNDNDTTLPTSAAVKDYADTKAVLSGSTNNNVATVTGAHALVGEGNLTFNGSTLAVTGAATISTTLGVTGASTLDGVTITDNTISTNASNAPLEIKANGTGAVIITSGGVAFTMPTTDGNDGDFLKSNGSGVLAFASSTSTPSDDTRVVIKENKTVSTSPRTVDYFQSSSADMAWYFVALNDLTNDRSSASCFTVCHNDTDAFASGPRGGASGSANSLPSTSADISSSQVRVKITAPSDDSKITYYKIPISRANTADATAGVTVTTSNTDVDSASEVIDSFAHATFRAAKYTILIDNNTKTETGVIEALVVHDGSEAFITTYGTVNTGDNDMVTLTAQIVLSNVVISAAGLEPNLSLKIHKTLLKDSMTAVSNGNQKIIGATTVSSAATTFDNYDLDDTTAAMYYVVGGNSSEGEFSVYEVYTAGAPGEASVTPGPYVSTKATSQLQFTAGFKADADNSLELFVSSTSGASTVVNAYRINGLAE